MLKKNLKTFFNALKVGLKNQTFHVYIYRMFPWILLQKYRLTMAASLSQTSEYLKIECLICCTVKELRKLSCGQLLCSDCIGKFTFVNNDSCT